MTSLPESETITLRANKTLPSSYRAVKRSFDIVCALAGLGLVGWMIPIGGLLARIETRQRGIFRQIRIGRFGEPFRIYKIRTMRTSCENHGHVTTSADRRITRSGRWLRRFNIDEIPQLINVLLGHMSLVGPRPDVPGFADSLAAEDQCVLWVRPGITGPASIVFREEERLLSLHPEPTVLNRQVIFPEKVRLNRNYVGKSSFFRDLVFIIVTCLPFMLRRRSLRVWLLGEAYSAGLPEDLKSLRESLGRPEGADDVR